MKFFAMFAAAALFGSSPHSLAQVTPFENEEYELKLEDGSLWKVSNYDSEKTNLWSENDPVTITQNNRWFSRHNYLITNEAKGTFVEANLFRSPDPYGPHTLYIVGIDHDKKELLLNNRTAYEISFLDFSVFRHWSNCDIIFVATNSNINFLDSGKEILLINASTSDHVRAKLSQ